MRKIVKISISIVCIITLALTISGAYWFIIHPKTYNYDTAVKNGDVVMGASGLANIDKLHSFIKNVENMQPDKIRITAYSKEGYPEIFDLDFDGKLIKCTTDNTRNLYGRDFTKKHGEYTRITKDENYNYMLEDEAGKSVFIFQE